MLTVLHIFSRLMTPETLHTPFLLKLLHRRKMHFSGRIWVAAGAAVLVAAGAASALLMKKDN